MRPRPARRDAARMAPHERDDLVDEPDGEALGDREPGVPVLGDWGSLNPPAASSAERRTRTELGLSTTLWRRSGVEARSARRPPQGMDDARGLHRLVAGEGVSCAQRGAGVLSRWATPAATRWGASVVGVEEGDQRRRRGPKPALRARPAPPCGRVEVAHAAIRVPCRDLGGLVGRSVVDHEHRQVRIALREHALDGLGEEAAVVVAGDDRVDRRPVLRMMRGGPPGLGACILDEEQAGDRSGHVLVEVGMPVDGAGDLGREALRPARLPTPRRGNAQRVVGLADGAGQRDHAELEPGSPRAPMKVSAVTWRPSLPQG